MRRLLQAVTAAWLAWGLVGAADVETVEAVKPKKTAMDFTFVDINPGSATHGQEVSLGRARAGRGVVVNFLASWCTYCWEELPELERLYLADAASVVGIALDEGDDTDEVKNLRLMLDRAKLSIPVLYVPSGRKAWMESFYDYELLPATYLIDREGAVRRVFQGKVPFEALESEIRRTLGP